MATTRPFSYNPPPSTPIEGTINIGTLCIGVSPLEYSANTGGLTWWMGPDEDNSYVIAKDVSAGNFPTQLGNIGNVQFWRSTNTDEAFTNLVSLISGTTQLSASEASDWLSLNGYWTNRVGSSFDPDAQAFITAAGITNPTQQTAIDQLVLDLKSYSIWSSMIAIYPFVGGNATSHRYNLKSADSYLLTFYGDWTHTSTGALPNGINAYADTGISPLSTLGSSHNYSVYSGTNNNYPGNTIGSFELGGYTCGENGFVADLQLYLSDGSNILIRDQANGNYIQISNADTSGYFTVNRNSTALNVYKNGTSIGSASISQALPEATIALSAAHAIDFDCVTDYYTDYDNKELAFVTFANSSLTSINIANLNTAVQSFQTTLGR